MRSQVEAELLPPIEASLVFKIKRSHYICKIWENANNPIPDLPSPENSGWKKVDNVYEAVMTDQHPVAEAVVEHSICRCNTGCKSMRCKCRKNNLTCTEMCFCEECGNRDEDDDDFTSDDEDTDNEKE